MNTINREDGIKGRPSSCMSVENFMAIWIGFGVTHTIPVYCFGQNSKRCRFEIKKKCCQYQLYQDESIRTREASS